MRSACRHRDAGRHLRGAAEKLRTLERSRHHRDRADAARRLSRARAIGVTTACCMFAPNNAYGTPDDLKRLHRPGARARPHGLHRRRLQSLRAERELPARLRQDLLHRASSDAVGRRASMSIDETAARVRDFFIAQCALLDRRIPYRRPAFRCRACHRSTIATSISSTRSPQRSARAFPDRHVHLILENEENEASWLDRDARGQAAALHRAMERRHPPLLARADDRRERRLLRRFRRRHDRAARPRARGRLRLSGRAYADIATASRAANRPAICRRRRLFRSSRTTIRSAIAPWASASPR